MTEDEFRAAMNASRRDDRLLWVANDEVFGIAVGYDSGRSIVHLHGGAEVPMASLREITPP